jgi:hypothetical protein
MLARFWLLPAIMTKTWLAMGLLVATPMLAPAEAPLPSRQQLVPPGELESVVRVRDVLVADNEASGTIVNLTDDELRDVRLRIRDFFLWRNERRPGTDDFSRAEEFVVRGPIPPRSALAFTAPRSPLPTRSDGDFRTSIEVTALTRQPVGAQTQPSAVAPPPPAGTMPSAGTAPAVPPVGSPPPVEVIR